MDGISQVESQLNDFVQSTDRLETAYTKIFSTFSGQSINRYHEVVTEYMQSAQLAESYIETFIQLIHLMDKEIKEADRKSAKMLSNLNE